MPRVLEANRHERFDREIMNEMGELGLLGATMPASTAARRSTTSATASWPGRWSGSIPATAPP
jgi:alkylation response protein AidB-like acyl-CoA dehydrogenase